MLAFLLIVAPGGVAAADQLQLRERLEDMVPATSGEAGRAPSIAGLAPPASGPRRAFTITLGGDLGLGGHGAPVDARGARRQGALLSWDELTAGIRPLLDGDVNFANLETVVTDRNDLRPEPKAFVFRSHPDGIRHLARIGFNLLSTANNHAVDYGVSGMRETLHHLDRLAGDGRIRAHVGLGETRAAAGRPRAFSVGSVRLAISAIGISTGGRAGETRPGIMEWRDAADVSTVIRRLAEASADLRILSVHHGLERSVVNEREAIRKLRHQAVVDEGLDLVVGHHAHVVRGIERTSGRLIFYGLGNLLHPGMQNMAPFDMCRDYGLLARVHFADDPAGRLAVRAVEVIPLTDMHWRARPMPAREARERIHVLNHLAAALDEPEAGARGLRFAPQADGTGLHCEPGAAGEPGRVGKLCRGWTGPPTTPAALAARIASACGEGALIAGTARARKTSVEKTATRVVQPPAQSAAMPSVVRRNTWVGGVFAGN